MKTIQLNGDYPGLLIDDLHYLFKADDQDQIKELQKLLLQHVKHKTGENLGSLEDLHRIFDSSNVNAFRLSCFDLINNMKLDWAEIVKKLAFRIIKERIGPDYLIQQKANISIQMPFDKTSILPIHSDCISGESPWQHNLWIPLTRASNTAAMFMVSKEETINYVSEMQKIHDKNKSNIKNGYANLVNIANNYKKYFLDCKDGDILVFCPLVLHGNTINKESYTRVSINIRLKSIYAPDSCYGNVDRENGTFYRVGNISASGNAAIEFDKVMKIGQ